MPAKSITPSFSSRSMVLSSMPIWSSGVMSAVMAPFEASVMVLRQNGTSSWIETGVGPLRPMTLNWLFGRSCAAAAETRPANVSPSNACFSICISPKPIRRAKCVTNRRRLAMQEAGQLGAPFPVRIVRAESSSVAKHARSDTMPRHRG